MAACPVGAAAGSPDSRRQRQLVKGGWVDNSTPQLVAYPQPPPLHQAALLPYQQREGIPQKVWQGKQDYSLLLAQLPKVTPKTVTDKYLNGVTFYELGQDLTGWPSGR